MGVGVEEACELRLEGVELAVIDVDHTLVDGATGLILARDLARAGHIRWSRLAVGGWWLMAHRLGIGDVHTALRQSAVDFGGMDFAFIRGETEASFARSVKPRIFPAAYTLVRRCREQGAGTLLLSATGDVLVELLAAELGADHAVGNSLEVVDGVATGRLVEPFCYGPGKLEHLQAFLETRGLTLEQCAAFADSQSDLPLLEAVGRPHAVNPDRKLRRVARARDWPVLRFFPARA